MGEVQLWQSDGLGTDKDTLGKVLRIFKSDGVQGIQSQQALNAYIRRLDDSKLREMYKIDGETALQLFVDCFGVSCTAEKYSKWENETIRLAVDILIKEKETAEQEAETNRTALQNARKVLNEEIDRIRQEYGILKYEKEETDQQIKELRDTLAHYKADLYDFYAQAGKLPKYESIMVAVNSGAATNYIPCVCFGWQAFKANTLEIGDYVEIYGRFQSRDYKKRIEGRKLPFLSTVYEVCAIKFKSETKEKETEPEKEGDQTHEDTDK